MQQANARKDAPAGDAPSVISGFAAGAAEDQTLLPSGGSVQLIRFPLVLIDSLGWFSGSDTIFTCPKAGYYDIVITCSLDSPLAAVGNYGLWFQLTAPHCVVRSSERNTGTAVGRDAVNIRAFDFFELGDQLYVQGAQFSASALNSPDVGQANNYLIINPIG